MNIDILTYQNGWRRGPCDFYPLIKWRRNLKKDGIRIRFISDHNDEIKSDVVIIDHRYYAMIIKNNKRLKREGHRDKNFIKEYISSLSARGKKVILFENGDEAGSRHFDMIEFVDLYVKKQVLKVVEDYTKDNGFANKMVFVDSYDLTEEQIQKNQIEAKEEIIPCPSKEVYKIRCGWNIGLQNYLELPFKRIYPNNVKALLSLIIGEQKFADVIRDRAIDASYRGALLDFSENYNWQRKKVIEYLKKNSEFHFITGKGLPKKEYLEEMRRSKLCISPFGWGEVCYRDFEAVINGCVLVKPHMNHIQTYPDIYQDGTTYASLEWDLNDMDKTVRSVLNNYQDYQQLTDNAQEVYKESMSSYDSFLVRFKQIIFS